MIKYKIDVYQALKDKGYNTNIIKRDNLHGKSITFETLNKICILLRCQPGDIIECVITDPEKIKYFR